MTKSSLVCTSCKTSISNLKGSVKFKCPSCGDIEIIRCNHCRKIVAPYNCPKCNFKGPN